MARRPAAFPAPRRPWLCPSAATPGRSRRRGGFRGSFVASGSVTTTPPCATSVVSSTTTTPPPPPPRAESPAPATSDHERPPTTTPTTTPTTATTPTHGPTPGRTARRRRRGRRFSVDRDGRKTTVSGLVDASNRQPWRDGLQRLSQRHSSPGTTSFVDCHVHRVCSAAVRPTRSQSKGVRTRASNAFASGERSRRRRQRVGVAKLACFLSTTGNGQHVHASQTTTRSRADLQQGYAKAVAGDDDRSLAGHVFVAAGHS